MPARAWTGSLTALAFLVLGLIVLAPSAAAESLQDTEAKLGEGLWDGSAVWTGEALYVFGGSSEAGVDLQTDKIWRVDPATGQVDVLETRLPSSRAQISAVWTGEHVYLFGGWGCEDSNTPDAPLACKDILRFTPSTGKLEDTGEDLPVPGPPVTSVWTGRLAYLFPDETRQILEFDPADETITTLDKTFQEDRPGASAAWDGNAAYVIGGGDTDTIVRWDPDNADLREMDARLPSPRNDTAARFMGEKIYIFGGDGAERYDDVLSYRPFGSQVDERPVAFDVGRSSFPAAGNASTTFLVGGETEEGFTDRIARYVPGNSPPEAEVDVTRDIRTVTVNATLSTDPDGDIQDYHIDWGDGNQTHGDAVSTHTYRYEGTYDLTVTVEDEHGSTDSVERTLFFDNQEPSAEFKVTIDEGRAHVDAGPSYDPDGTIEAYRWSWGDGEDTAGSAQETHSYHDDRQYEIVLEIEDQDGATATVKDTVDIHAYPPRAQLDVEVDGWTVEANATASRDPGGQIRGYEITWGDGDTSTGALSNHTYTRTGDHRIQLTIKDDDGNTDQANRTVTIEDQPPETRFTTRLEGNVLHVDASNTTDVNGRVTSYEWTWDDGSASSTGVQAEHAYTDPGTYDVQLIAHDASGNTGKANRTITVGPQAPHASMNLTVQGLRVQADASDSRDPDGTIETYRWSWDDGDETVSEASTNHLYAGPGTYNVSLTIVDDDGTKAKTWQTVHIENDDMQPEARMALETEDLTVYADAEGSKDPDGELASLTWHWGDGTTTNGTTASHTYDEPGTYKIRLEVVDESNDTGWADRIVRVPADASSNARLDPSIDMTREDRTVKARVDPAPATDPSAVLYRWTLGDGTTATGNQVHHEYKSDGIYTIELVAEHDNGTIRSVTRSFKITSSPDIDHTSLSKAGSSDDDPLPNVQGNEPSSDPEDARKDSPLGLAWLAAGLAAALVAGRLRPRSS